MNDSSETPTNITFAGLSGTNTNGSGSYASGFGSLMKKDGAAPGKSLSLSAVATLLGTPGRWHILRELAKGEALPVGEIAKRAKMSADSASKHMAYLRKIGLARRIYGRLYTLAPAYRPAPGSTALDLGHCIIPAAPDGDDLG